jgi:large subunit ribosomal protein L1
MGKASFDAKQLTENYAAILDELLRAKPASSKGRYLRSIHVSAAMSPSIRIDTTQTRELWKEPTAA